MAIATVTKNYTFVASTTAKAAEVNANLDTIYSKVNELIPEHNTVVGRVNQDLKTTASPAFVAVTANLTGDVTGNVTGNLTGNVTGNVLGDLEGDFTGNLTGNVTGNLTGDVTGNLTGNVTGNVSGSAGSCTGNAATATAATTAVDSSATGSIPYARYENALRIVRGIVAISGTTNGAGFTAVNSSTNVYTITFAHAFGDVPVVIANAIGTTAKMVTVDSVTTGGCVVRGWFADALASAQAQTFGFIAIGPN